MLAAITDPVRLAVLLKAIRAYKGSKVVRLALTLAPRLYQRLSSWRMLGRTELYLEKGLWTIPSADMKRGKAEQEHGEDHVEPRPSQAIELLTRLSSIPVAGNRFYRRLQSAQCQLRQLSAQSFNFSRLPRRAKLAML